jgi:lysophospholipase L1-like esterase
VNRYTTFIVPTNTFTDAPANLKDGGYAVFRTNAYSDRTINIVWLYGLTNPNDIWFATYNIGRTPALSAWYKIPAGLDAGTVADAIITGNYQIKADCIEQGWWNWGSKSDNSKRIRYNALLKVNKYTVVNYNVSSAFDIYLGVAPYPGATEWSEYLYWTQGDGQNNKYFINHDGYLGIILRKHDNSDITPSEYNSIISVDSSPSCPKLDRLTCKIFRKVVCCGDSYTAGYIRTDEPAGTPSVMTHEDYAWPHYMETLTGNKWENCGSSGATTVTWQTVQRGLPKAQSLGKSQAYVIGLMINDVGTTYHVDIGTISDIGTDANTYYAQMSKIIRELHTINEDAIIFVNTCPRTDPDFAPYNKAVRDIVNAYKTTYHAHCVDLYNYKYLYDNASLTGDSLNGHFSAIGYEQFAEIYAYILSDYINSHITDFQSVHKIPYDE